MIYKILKYFWYISNDDMITIVSETCKTLEKDFKQEKDRLINLIVEKDNIIESKNSIIDSNNYNYDLLESNLKDCISNKNDLSDKCYEYYITIEKLKDKNKALSENNNVLNSRSTSAIKSRDNWKDKYNKLVWKIALKNATHK